MTITQAYLWIDAASYLPLRQELAFSTGVRTVTDYSFLAPTAANLAKLRPVIPAGYHHTTYIEGKPPKKPMKR